MINKQIILKFIHLFIYFFIFLFLYLFIYSNNVRAQQITLSISPPVVELLVKPDKSLLIGYTIRNLADPTPLSVKVRTFSPQGDYGEIVIDPELISPIRFSLDNTDMQFEQPFFMKSRDTVQALLRIRVPEGTPEGDYYFTVLAETEPAPQIGGTSTSVAKATIGSNLLLTVTKSGRVEVKGRISLFQMTPDFTFHMFGREYQVVESGRNIPVDLVVQNTGKNLIKPQGEIVLRGPLGQKTSYSLFSQNVLADSSRLLRTLENNESPVLHTVNVSGYFMGVYTLSANVNFGEGASQLYANTSFIGVPIRFSIAMLVILTISVLIIVSKRKRRKE
ncbi:hypothetical protein HZC27_00335 [Candidatus Roizmanbacteria bacterium]|nr:hypothetical protein [Candidatus Roizmanbacteria bacterium]